jgi:glutamyl-Q tRNA(Asp) synthetase
VRAAVSLATGATPYIGRFAPSPSGPLHAGSVLAALASWLDARAQHGTWLVRIEDVDQPRCVPGTDDLILRQLAALGMVPDALPQWQSTRGHLYRAALDRLIALGRAYPCICSRKDIEAVWASRGVAIGRHQELVYPGTCRASPIGHPPGGQPASWRFKVDAAKTRVEWQDRRLGAQQQDVASQVGDFVLLRSDGLWAYQLAVVVDDAEQGVTHVVRGVDLADNTPRQILLQGALGLPRPAYLHTPLVLGADGQKLSKQNGVTPIDMNAPMATLNAAAAGLGLTPHPGSVPEALPFWVNQWSALSAPSPPDTREGEPPAPPTPSPPDTGERAGVRGLPHMRGIKSFVLRAGRKTVGQSRALQLLAPKYLLPYAQTPLDLAQAFGRDAPTLLEIGFGMGEATAHIAALLPGKNFLGCEVHEPGVGALLNRIAEQGLKNIRIVQHDAVEVIDHMLRADSLDGVFLFFPDPWHKKRHHKRRLLQAPFVERLAHRLKVGGTLHCATDWQPYAEQMLAVLGAEPLLCNTAEAYAPRPDYRPLTKFEKRGLKLGHGVWDLVFRRV